MDELRPCPFCGGEATLSEDDGGYLVDCGVCGAAVGYFGRGLPDARGAAVAAWNRRAERTCGEWRGDPRPDAVGWAAEHEDDELWCEHCDVELDEDWTYCPHCGARIEVSADADR